MPKIKAFSYIHEPDLQRVRARIHETIREGWEPVGGLLFANGEYVQAVSKTEEAGPSLEGGAPARKAPVDRAALTLQAVNEWQARCTMAQQNAAFVQQERDELRQIRDDLRSKLGEARNDAASWCETARAEQAKVEELQKLAKTHGTERIKELEAACVVLRDQADTRVRYHEETIRQLNERHDQFYQGYNRQKLLLQEAIALVRSAKQFLGPLSTAYTLFAKLANFLGRIDKMPSCG